MGVTVSGLLLLLYFSSKNFKKDQIRYILKKNILNIILKHSKYAKTKLEYRQPLRHACLISKCLILILGSFIKGPLQAVGGIRNESICPLSQSTSESNCEKIGKGLFSSQDRTCYHLLLIFKSLSETRVKNENCFHQRAVHLSFFPRGISKFNV